MSCPCTLQKRLQWDGVPEVLRDLVERNLSYLYECELTMAENGTLLRLRPVTKKEREKNVGEKNSVSSKSSGVLGNSSPSESTEASVVPEEKVRKNDRRAHMRLKEAFASINRKLAPHNQWISCTLTVPYQVDDLPRKLSEVLKSSAKATGTGDAVAIWRRELQGRGVEHLHVEIFFSKFQGGMPPAIACEFGRMLRAKWTKKTSGYGIEDTEDHLSVDLVDDPEHLEKIQEYLAKDSQDEADEKKWEDTAQPVPTLRGKKRWGIINRRGYDGICSVYKKRISLQEGFQLRRLIRRYINALMRSSDARKRFRPSRYQVNGRFTTVPELTVLRLLKQIRDQLREVQRPPACQRPPVAA